MRVRQLEQIQQQFARQQHRVLELQSYLAQAREQIQQQLSIEPDIIIDPIISQQRFRYIQYLKMQVQHILETLQKETFLLEQLREQMKQAHIQKKTLEILKEKQNKAYLTHLENQEIKELEDIVIARQHQSQTRHT